MATAQMLRNETKQGDWTSMFPADQVTEVKSTLFVKKLLAVAVSSISYLRALFPENAFGDRCLEDIHLKILRDDSSFPDACKVIKWLRGCFDALEKKYLRAVMIGVYEDPDKPNTVIEEYSFRFSYGDGKGMDVYRNGAKILSANTPDGEMTNDKEIKNATIRLLRTIVLLSQTLAPLPDNVMMAMKLLYYDEVTPEDYNPPGFKECNVDTYEFNDEEPVNFKAGNVSTNFHSLKVRVKTLYNELSVVENDNGEQEEKEANENEEAEETDVDATIVGNDVTLDEEAVVPTDGEEMEGKVDLANISNISALYAGGDEKVLKSDEETLTATEDEHELPLETEDEETPDVKTTNSETPIVPDTDETKTECICGVNEDDGMMILCASCNTWQHAVCYAIVDSKNAPEPHYCVACAGKYDVECSDPELENMGNMQKIAEYCLWRRALMAVVENARVQGTTLSKRLAIPVSVANYLVKRMEEEGFVTACAKGKRFGKVVQKSEIMERGLKTYFRNRQNKNEEAMDGVIEKAANMEIEDDERLPIESTKRKQVTQNDEKDPYLFEISNTQQNQASPDSSMNPRKRRKTSIPLESVACF